MEKQCTPLVGESNGICSIRELLPKLADVACTVLITGETGVGKEVVVRNLFAASKRKHRPLVKINCAAMPEGLLESELFGYEVGAFTGAVGKKKGRLEMADGGALFLDEIGDMSPVLQPKLLHVLETGEFSPLGSHGDIKMDIWLICATNQDLEARIRNGRFRADLYERMRGYEIFIPPLRNRLGDIPLLVEHFLKNFETLHPDREVLRPSSDQFRRLMQYPWPGNVRELENMSRRILITGCWDEIIDGLLARSRSIAPPLSPEHSPATSFDLGEDLAIPDGNAEKVNLKKIRRQAVQRVERKVIGHMLERTHWNRSKACKILGISYKTLLSKINELEIRPTDRHREKPRDGSPYRESQPGGTLNAGGPILRI